MDMEALQPLVSVRTITYNHEKFIAQCLEGILMQRTNFPFEVVVGEDCSTDRTREIVLTYGREYPDKIRLILSEENVGGARNTRRVLQACRGKYHAFCEGDDYWIDPLKLQKQVDYMEAHPDTSVCFHNAFVLQEGSRRVELYYPYPMHSPTTIEEALQTKWATASMLVRSNVFSDIPEWRSNVWNSDVVLRMWCAHRGTLGYLDEIMSVYFRHAGGLVATMYSSRQKRYEQAMYLYTEFDKETRYQYTGVISKIIRKVKDQFQRERLGLAYYFLHPMRLFSKARIYYQTWYGANR